MQDQKIVVSDSTKSKMLVKTGLLVVSNPKHIGRILPSLRKHVNNTLYIQLISALKDPFGSFYPNVFNVWPKFSQTITGIYTQATQFEDIDVRVLLSGLKYKNAKYIKTTKPIDLVIFDKEHSEDDIHTFIRNRVKSITEGYKILTADSGTIEEPSCDASGDLNVYKHSVLGGTFDRLHIAHKLLLTEAALRASEKITVGVTDENMLASKTLWELIEPIDQRLADVSGFLEDIDPELERQIVPIRDIYGPSKDDPTMDVIVVSAETVRGAYKVNEARTEKGLQPLNIISVELIKDPNPSPNEELKISSSTCRIRSLGNLFKPVASKEHIPSIPYIIGLTGGICSGKSGVTKRLEELGAHVINCDKVAHELYEPGMPAHEMIVNEFGKSVLFEDGRINRKELGAMVFKDPKQLQKLNSLLWPIMMVEIQKRIRECKTKVIVIEAAILLGAGWDKHCHEVWTTVIPPNEAIKRLQERNGLSEEEAKARLAAQLSNKKYIEASNVVICSLWPVEYTRKQIDKAWQLLLRRIPTQPKGNGN